MLAALFAYRLHRLCPTISLSAWGVFTGVLAYAFLIDSNRLRGGYSDWSLVAMLLTVYAGSHAYRWIRRGQRGNEDG
jgi:cytochrome c oxidase subunit IV